MNTPTNILLSKKGIAAAALGALAALSTQAQTLYLITAGSNWDYVSTPWAISSGGTADTVWTNSSNAVMQASSIKLAESDLVVGDFDSTSQANFYLQGTGTLEVTGSASSKTLQLWSSSAINLILSGSTAWNGTLRARESLNSIIFSNIAATGTVTKVALDNGALKLDAGIAGGTAVIGELSGSSITGQISASYGTFNVATKTLKVDQSTDSTYAGRFMLGSNGRTLALTKAGTGTLTLTGGLYHAGGVTVEGGKLVLSSTATTADQGDYTVASGGNLVADTTINFANAAGLTVQNGGILTPGGASGVGTLTLAGGTGVGLTLEAGAQIAFRLGGSEQDAIVLSESSMVGSALGGVGSVEFVFTDLGGLVEGNAYDLITFGDTPAIAASTFTSETAGIFQYSGNTLQFVYAIPEPSTYALMLGGALALLVFVQKRRS